MYGFTRKLIAPANEMSMRHLATLGRRFPLSDYFAPSSSNRLSADMTSSAKLSTTCERKQIVSYNVEEARNRMISVMEQPKLSGKLVIPPSLLARLPTDASSLVPQVIYENKWQLLIPLSTRPLLRNKYNSHKNVLRMGRLLEDIDMCAGGAAMQHAQQLVDPESGRFPLVVVTALVDRIILRNAILPADRDIRVTGYVSWVGRSSVEVTVDVEQQSSESSFWNHVLQAHLVFVARHPITQRPVPYVPIRANDDDPVGQTALRDGARRNEVRQLAAQQSLLKTIPSLEETELIHNLFLSTIDQHKLTFRQRQKPQDALWISETGVKTALVCHAEERNVYNKIFGGFLMRQALEIAWVTVRHFACEYPVLVAIDDLVFKHPVEVGSMLFLSSFVVYHPPDTRHYVVRVNVEVVSIDPITHVENRLVTNTAYFIYAVPNSDTKLRNVLPETYAESMMYLDGKRHYEAVINHQHTPVADGSQK